MKRIQTPFGFGRHLCTPPKAIHSKSFTHFKASTAPVNLKKNLKCVRVEKGFHPPRIYGSKKKLAFNISQAIR